MDTSKTPLTEVFVPPTGGESSPTALPGDRYEVIQEIARGGMGAVLLVRDRVLNRTLAMKVLLERHRDRPDMVQRFKEEAQIAGQLQHPGVVPIHELGTLADERPFFAMKLVKGRTLAEMLAARATPADELPRFLGIFAQVCQTVAFAHSRGVIHRDLKPANIMVGNFAEVQVMDWGLAKVLASGGGQPAKSADVPGVSVIETVRSGDSSQESVAGSVLGTFAYMAPEQARGQSASVDRRSDVFGLGALLCEILTGTPPYTAPRPEDVKYRAIAADLDPALTRLQECGAERELIDLAAACLALEPGERPTDASAVAAALESYQAGQAERLKKAEEERLLAQTRARHEKKARRLAEQAAQQQRHANRLRMALIGVFLLLAALGVIAYFWFERLRLAREEAVAEQVEQRYEEAALLRLQAKTEKREPAVRWTQALESARRASDLLSEVSGLEGWRAAVEELHRLIVQEKAEFDDAERLRAQEQGILDGLERLRAEVLFLRPGKGVTFEEIPGMTYSYEALFRRHGVDVAELDIDESARRLRRFPSRLRIAVGLFEWAMTLSFPPRFHATGLSSRLTALGEKLVRDEPAGPQLQAITAALARGDRASLREVTAREELLRMPAALITLLAKSLALSGDLDGAIGVLRRGQLHHVTDFWINYDLGYYLIAHPPPAWEEARTHLTAAASLRPDHPDVWNNLGVCHMGLGLWERASACLEKAVALAPGRIEGLNNLGAALFHQKRSREAAVLFERALRQSPEDFTAAWHLCQVLVDLKRWGEAGRVARRAIELGHAQPSSGVHITFDRTTAPTASFAPHRLRIPYMKLTAALMGGGNRDGAIAVGQRFLELDPLDITFHSLVGGLLAQRDGLGSEAVVDHLELAACLSRDGQEGRAEMLANLTGVYVERNQYRQAVACGTLAVQEAPDNVLAHRNLGMALIGLDRVAESIAHLEKARRCESSHPGLALNLGNAYRACERYDESWRVLTAALDLPGADRPAIFLALTRTNLGRKRLPDVIACLRAYLALRPEDDETRLLWGRGLAQLGQFQEAARLLREVTQRQPDQELPWSVLASVLIQQKDLPAADEVCRRGLRHHPHSADIHVVRAVILDDQKRHGEAMRHYQAASQFLPPASDKRPLILERYNALRRLH